MNSGDSSSTSGMTVSDWLSGSGNTYQDLANQWGTTGTSGVSDLGGYQKDLSTMTAENQSYLKDLISGAGSSIDLSSLKNLADAFSTPTTQTQDTGVPQTTTQGIIGSPQSATTLQSTQPQQVALTNASIPSYKASNVQLKQLDPAKLKQLVSIIKARMATR